MPSSLMPGGIRMSVSTTSGRCSSTAAMQLVVARAGADEVEGGGRVEDRAQSLADDLVVLGEDDPHGHGDTLVAVPC